MSFLINPHVFAGSSGIEFVGSKTFVHNSTSAQSVSLTDLKDTGDLDATLLENDLVLIALTIAYFDNLTQADLLCEDPAAATYTPAHDKLDANDSSDSNFQTQYKFMGSTPDTSVTVPSVPSTSYSCSATIMAFRGVDTGNPLDVTATTATGINTGQPDPPAITPSTAGSLIAVCCGGNTNGSTAYTNPGDLSSTTNHFRSQGINVSSMDGVSGIGIKTDWASGAFDPAGWTGSSSLSTLSWCAATLALRPA